MDRDTLSRAVMIDAFYDELEKLSMKKSLKRYAAHYTADYEEPLSRYFQVSSPAETWQEQSKLKAHSMGRRAAKLLRRGKKEEAADLIRDAKLIASIRKG